ncbi:DUF3231 family protein [Oceanobacillus sp. CF4.6]|uniref:DUF3231 family protein n=1 Tax=Oceanobacillus sp. CF4.6 TaxID=3373080 RepID=UPI003EE5AAB9
MNNQNSIGLTAPEVSAIWISYQSNTMGLCGLTYFLQHVEDEQIKGVLEKTLAITKQNVERETEFFKQEGHVIPQGFTEHDVIASAPRLFSDKLFLEYILAMTNISLNLYSASLTAAVRTDVIDYFSTNLIGTQELHKLAKELAKEKGIYLRAPQIPKQKQIDFVKKQIFLAGWFADRRPLLGVEVANLVLNAKQNALGQAVITGFSQVAQSKEVRRFFERGRDISGKHVEIFESILNDDYLSDGAYLLTSEVSDSTTPPFSDKLMLFLVSMLIGYGIGQYGVSVSVSPRRDLGAHYTRLIAEIAQYSEDCANIMIDNGWMEQPPMAADRKELAN